MATLVLTGPKEADLKYVRGDTKPFQVALTDSTGAAVDVTGYTVLWTISTRKNPDDIVDQVLSLAGSIVNPASAGRFEFAPTANDTNLVGDYYYDIQVTNDVGKKETILKGMVTFVQDITK